MIKKFYSLIDQQVQKAQEEGVFNNLSGFGKPLPKDPFVDLPESIRMYYRIMKEAGFTPRPVQLFKDIEKWKSEIANSSDDEKIKELQKMIQLAQTEIELEIESIKKPELD